MVKTAFFTLKTSYFPQFKIQRAIKKESLQDKRKRLKLLNYNFKARKEDQFNKFQPPSSSLSKTIEQYKDFYIFAWVL